MMTKIDEIVSKEALDQIDLLNSKLKEAISLEKKLGGSVALKVNVLTELYKVIGGTIHQKHLDEAIIKKLNELIPLL